LGQLPTHLLSKRRDPWLLADQDAVGIDELPAGLAYFCGRAAQQVERRRALPLRLLGRKQRADVAEPSRTEQSVDQGVSDHVPVRVAREALRRFDRDSPEYQRDAVRELVAAHPQSDPELAHPSGSCRRSRRSKTVTVS